MNSAEELLCRVVKHWDPPPRLSLSQWADRYRRTSREASAEVGQWVTRPYQREPLDAFTDPYVHVIVIMSAVQMLKTELILNALGYVIHLDPGPILVVQFRDTDCDTFSKVRLAPMLRDTPVLQGLVTESKSRNSGNTITHKTFPGGHLRIAASGSPGNLAALPIRYGFCDEIDKYPASAGSEGDPLSLIEGRFEEFQHNYKEILTCSPTVAGHSRIEKAFNESDKREYFVPCPECGHPQILKWPQVRWDNTLPTLYEQAKSARYVCENETCNAEWDDVTRGKAIERGSYRATAPFHGIAGFRLSSLCSLKKKLSKVVLKFLRAQGDIERLKAFFNTEIAETWVEKGDAPEYEQLLERREEYSVGTAPRGGLFLTAGADVHPDRIEVELVAWGRNRESWSIDYRIFEGRTSELLGQPGRPSPWQQLEGFLAETFPHDLGGNLPISRLFVDSGNQSNDVYQWVRTQAPGRVVATKGVQRSNLPVGQPSPVDVTVGGRKVKHGLNIRTVWVDFFKAEFYADLRKRKPTAEEIKQGWTYPPGYCHFPKGKNYGDEHFQQICAEQLVTRTNKRTGRSKRQWEQTRPRNEALDTRILARAAAWDFGMDRFQEKHWASFEGQLSVKAADTPTASRPSGSTADRSSWLGSREGKWFRK